MLSAKSISKCSIDTAESGLMRMLNEDDLEISSIEHRKETYGEEQLEFLLLTITNPESETIGYALALREPLPRLFDGEDPEDDSLSSRSCVSEDRCQSQDGTPEDADETPVTRDDIWFCASRRKLLWICTRHSRVLQRCTLPEDSPHRRKSFKKFVALSYAIHRDYPEHQLHNHPDFQFFSLVVMGTFLHLSNLEPEVVSHWLGSSKNAVQWIIQDAIVRDLVEEVARLYEKVWQTISRREVALQWRGMRQKKQKAPLNVSLEKRCTMVENSRNI